MIENWKMLKPEEGVRQPGKETDKMVALVESRTGAVEPSVPAVEETRKIGIEETLTNNERLLAQSVRIKLEELQ